MSDENFRAMLAGRAKMLSGLLVDLEFALERGDAEKAVEIVHRLNVTAQAADWDVLRWRDKQRRRK